MLFEIIKAVLFGVVEGITEWLPVSSTTHMKLLDALVHLQGSERFMSVFEVVIQLGAILAVILMYLPRLWPFCRPGKGEGPGGMVKPVTFRMWLMIVLAILPSAVVGIPFDDWIDAHLDCWPVICATLVLYGIAFLLLDRGERKPGILRAEKIGPKTALLIGCAQILALIPGTSRSGSTILGALLLGCSRTAAVEFSFFMAIPTMAGASLIKLLKAGIGFSLEELLLLLIGCASAFMVSMTVIHGLVGYIKKHTFENFGWYRIILGLLIAILFAAGPLLPFRFLS